MAQFDTNFFERYAKITLSSLVDGTFDELVNKDRPDLQSPDSKSIGIEVTRAMEESKDAANFLLKEMAGIIPCQDDVTEMNDIITYGYGYGLQDGRYIGTKEYEYWALALPLKRILKSKTEKAGNGFYGQFDRLGLYVFCKDSLTTESVHDTMDYVHTLQEDSPIKYDTLYLSEISNLYVCSLRTQSTAQFPISQMQRKEFFIKAL